MPDMDVVARLRAANPVPSPKEVSGFFGEDVSDTLLEAIRTRGVEIEPTVGPSGVVPHHRPRLRVELRVRRRWLISIAAAALVLVAGVGSLMLRPPGLPLTNVEVVQAWGAAQSAYDIDSSARFLASGTENVKQQNLIGYWRALGAGIALEDCREETPSSVSCTAVLTGLPYDLAEMEAISYLFEVEDGLVQNIDAIEEALVHEAIPADQALADYAASHDRAATEAACEFADVEFDQVWAAPPVVYTAKCGELLATFVDEWAASVDVGA